MGSNARKANTRSVSLPAQSEPAIDLSGRSAQALVLERHAPSRIGFGLILRSQPWMERCLLSSDREEAVALGLACIAVRIVGRVALPVLVGFGLGGVALEAVVKARRGAGCGHER